MDYESESEAAPLQKREELPKEVLRQLRSSAATLLGVIEQAPDKFFTLLCETLSAECEKFSPSELPTVIRELVLEIMAFLVNEGRETTPLVSQLPSVELSRELSDRTNLSQLTVVRCYGEAILETYLSVCGNGAVWMTDFIPGLPKGEEFDRLERELFSQMLAIYVNRRMIDAPDEEFAVEVWNLMQSTMRSAPYVAAYCEHFRFPIPGTKLDRYELCEVAGVGGMGVVYRARRPHVVDRALKIMRLDCLEREKFRAEALLNSDLTDRRFLIMLDDGLDSDPPYYTTAFVEGGCSLADLLQDPAEVTVRGIESAIGFLGSRHSRPPRWRSLWNLFSPTHRDDESSLQVSSTGIGDRLLTAIVKSTAEAVHSLHTKKPTGFLHTDLKPSNLLISTEFGVIVSDLGLCRELSPDGTAPGATFAGTWKYASPEQQQQETLTQASDVYSLGIILRQGLRGHSLCHEQSSATELSGDLESVIVKATSEDASDRYPTCLALADDLGRFLDGKPVQAAPSFKWRNPLYAIQTSWIFWGTMVILLAGAGALWHSHRSAEEIPGCLASMRRYRTPVVIDGSVATLMPSEEWSTPIYSHIDIEKSSVYFDLSHWRVVPQNRMGERLEKSLYTRVIEFQRRDDSWGSERFRIQFHTSGAGIDLHCPTHDYQVWKLGPRQDLGGETDPVLVREIDIDISSAPVGKTQRVVVQAIIWNGFQKQESGAQWAGFLALSDMREADIGIRFPEAAKPPTLTRLTYFPQGSPAAAEINDQVHFVNPTDKPWWLWRPRDVKEGYIYKAEWKWGIKSLSE